jgi:hypothetical protein
VGVPPPKHVTPALVDQLARVRATSASQHLALLDGGPDPDVGLLDAIAWRSGPPELEPCDPVLRDLIDRARAQRLTWVEIAVAVGDTADPAGAARTQARQRWRHTTGGDWVARKARPTAAD